jgi:putative Holliday junction resolvase
MSDLVLAFDYGTRRIGVATANRHTRSATPLGTLQVGQQLPWNEIDRIVREWGPAQLVVGLPSGQANPGLLASIARFVAELECRYTLPVAVVDEQLSSQSARSDLAQHRRSGFLRRKTRRGRIDALAACLIAEQWLNAPSDTETELAAAPMSRGR